MRRKTKKKIKQYGKVALSYAAKYGKRAGKAVASASKSYASERQASEREMFSSIFGRRR